MSRNVNINGGVTIDGIEYVPKVPSDSPIRIVILQRGWVMVGRWHRDGDECELTDASVIRVWGTKKGLGELVSGPTSSTILDRAGTVNFHILTVVATILCEEKAWISRL